MEVVNNEQYNYEVEATYAEVLPMGENGAPIEVEKTATIKLRKLQRMNKEHCKLALALTDKEQLKDIGTIAEKFAACTIEAYSDEDKKMRGKILADLISCMNIFNNEAAQEDVERFLSKLDFVRAAINEAKAE